MRFEEQVTILCDEALAADNTKEVRRILAELRLVLHQHIKDLRSGLLAAYMTSVIRPDVRLEFLEHAARLSKPLSAEHPSSNPDRQAATTRTWQQVVHEIACEKDHARTQQLGLELRRLLQGHADSSPGG